MALLIEVLSARHRERIELMENAARRELQPSLAWPQLLVAQESLDYRGPAVFIP
jgi:hypothetical protein